MIELTPIDKLDLALKILKYLSGGEFHQDL